MPAKQYPKVRPEQTSILDTFSENSAENIGKIVQAFSPEYTTSNESNLKKATGVCAQPEELTSTFAYIYGPLTIITSDTNEILNQERGSTEDNAFVNSGQAIRIAVTRGNCVIKNTLIEITQRTYLTVYSNPHPIQGQVTTQYNARNSYLHESGDPTQPGSYCPQIKRSTQYVMAVVYYNPDLYKSAYLCLVNENTYEKFKEYICVLGIIQIDLNDSLVPNLIQESGITIVHPEDSSITRQEIWQWDEVNGEELGEDINLFPWPVVPSHRTLFDVEFDLSMYIRYGNNYKVLRRHTSESSVFLYTTYVNVIGGKAYHLRIKYIHYGSDNINFTLNTKIYYGDQPYSAIGCAADEGIFGVTSGDLTNNLNILGEVSQNTYAYGVEHTVDEILVMPESVNHKITLEMIGHGWEWNQPVGDEYGRPEGLVTELLGITDFTQGVTYRGSIDGLVFSEISLTELS